MKVFVIIFMVVATIYVLATLGCVIYDIVTEIRNKKESRGEKTE